MRGKEGRAYQLGLVAKALLSEAAKEASITFPTSGILPSSALNIILVREGEGEEDEREKEREKKMKGKRNDLGEREAYFQSIPKEGSRESILLSDGT